MRFAKPFLGVKAGEVYPTEFQPGDECPPELLDAARDLGVLDRHPLDHDGDGRAGGSLPGPRRRSRKAAD